MLKYILLGFLWVLLIIFLFILKNIIFPFIIVFILAYVLYPFIEKLNILTNIKFKNKIFSGIIILILYFFIIFIIYLLGFFFIPQLYIEGIKLIKESTQTLEQFDNKLLQEYLNNMAETFQQYNIPIQIIIPSLHKIQGALDITSEPFPLICSSQISISIIDISRTFFHKTVGYITAEFTHIILHLQKWLSHIFKFFFQFILIFMMSAFILIDITRIKKFIYQMIPKKNHLSLMNLLTKINIGLFGVIRGQLFICLINASLTLLGLVIFNVKFALLLSSIAGILSLIPVFGSIISTIPIVIVAISSSFMTGFLIFIWIIVIHLLEANILNPKIIGNTTKIHPTLILFALISGEYFYGIPGALLAVPLTSIIVVVLKSLLNWINE